MRLEISNPSDKATIDCTNMLAARLAVIILAEGAYGIIDDKDGNGMPIFLFGGHDEWFVKNHGMTFREAAQSIPKSEIADALESIQLEGKRTSMNNFVERAKRIADNLRKE